MNLKCEKKVFFDDDFRVETSFYSSPQSYSNSKSLVIFPPTGRTNLIDRSYARLFARKGFQVFIMDQWTGDTESNFDFEIHQRVHSRAQKALEMVLKNIHTEFKGLLGTSLGGIFSTTAAHLQQDLDAVFAITAGAPISELIVYSEQKNMQHLKKMRKKHLQMTSDKAQIQEISRNFFLDPLELNPLHKNKDLGLVIATRDTVVPASHQYLLRDFWKPKLTIEIARNHFWGIVFTWLFYRAQIFHFFEESASRKLSSSHRPALEELR